MGKFLRLKGLLSIALGLFALQAVVAPSHSVQHLAWARAATEVSQSPGSATPDVVHACAICAANASLSASLASGSPQFIAPDAESHLASGVAQAATPPAHFRPGARAPPVFLS